MKKTYFLVLVLFILVIFCGAAAPQSYSVTGIDMVLRFPDDYAVFGQKGQLNDVQVTGWTEDETSYLTEYMRANQELLYANQMDRYDMVYIDGDSLTESRGMQDFTKFCETSGLSDGELLEKLEEASYFRGPNSEVEDYSSESMEIVTINGEKYGYAVGIFTDEIGDQYVLEYNTVKNGKAIRLQMYISSGAPHDDQVEAFRGIVQSIGYQRGADGFLSQYIFGTNGAALIPWIILGICIIAGIVVLIVLLHIRRKRRSPRTNDARVGQGPVSPGAPYSGPVYGQPPTFAQGSAPGPYGQYSAPASAEANDAPQMRQPAPGPEQEMEVETTQTGQPEMAPQTSPQPAPQPGFSQGPAAAPSGPTDVMALLESLAELKRQGIITPEEYEQKKQELLKRL